MKTTLLLTFLATTLLIPFRSAADPAELTAARMAYVLRRISAQPIPGVTVGNQSGICGFSRPGVIKRLLANGATLQTIVDDKDTKRALLLAANSRVRHHYCAGGDEGEYTVELALIGDQPKRLPGDAQPKPFPDDAGASTFNGATREITVVVFPAHASSIVAFRKPLGGAEEQCGVSVDSTVGVSDFSPLVTGVTYELSWAGRNSRGFGKRSAGISFTA